MRIYEVFDTNEYINGAWYNEDRDVWFPAQWDIDGRFGQYRCKLDLVNR